MLSAKPKSLVLLNGKEIATPKMKKYCTIPYATTYKINNISTNVRNKNDLQRVRYFIKKQLQFRYVFFRFFEVLLRCCRIKYQQINSSPILNANSKRLEKLNLVYRYLKLKI